MYAYRVAFGSLCLATLSAAPATSETLFTEHVGPMLQKHCLSCHSGIGRQSGLDLSTRETALRGGDRGPAVLPGNPTGSILYKAIAHQGEPHMPYKGARLADVMIKRVEEWIKAGAPYDRRLETPSAVTGRAKQDGHWAFERPQRPAIPTVRNRRWVRNPIDAFVAAEHERRGLTPAPEASKRTLLRRVYLDLTGLPPAPEALGSFLEDSSADAYEHAVDHLLESPQYGERWARHWMDVWRYSDWYGWRKANDLRYSQKHVWRWRDWIVESLNRDKGYDRMVLEMIAGDEIAPGDPDVLRATGFLARNYMKYDRDGWMQDTVDHTAAAFLGLTVKCARCHDHKYDPIKQEEYYRLRAFFEPYHVRVDRVPGQPDVDKDGVARVYDKELQVPTYLFVRGDVRDPDKRRALEPGLPSLFGKADLRVEPVKLSVEHYYPDIRPFVHADLIAQAKADIERAASAQGSAKDRAAEALAGKQLTAATLALEALEARIAADKAKLSKPPADNAGKLAETALRRERLALLAKAEENLLLAQHELSAALGSRKPDVDLADEKKVAEARKKVDAAQAALAKKLEQYTPVGTIHPDASTGRRTALARWIASPENPLAARVAVNHMWMRHFGHPLVTTVFDFGRNGQPPTHPGLLDWLASELADGGWTMKAVHRLMVTSSAYRMQSADVPSSRNASLDAENRYLWRMNSRRMEAEAIRDSLIHVSGELDQTRGGPEIDETKGEQVLRRSLYFRHTPDLQVQFLRQFDSANPAECYQRSESIVPQQALSMANSELSYTRARVLARKLLHDSGASAPPAFVAAAFEAILGRQPSAVETTTGTQFLAAQARLYRSPDQPWPSRASDGKPSERAADPDQRARESFVHVLFNLNEFVTIR
jgi:hypothetical protein